MNLDNQDINYFLIIFYLFLGHAFIVFFILICLLKRIEKNMRSSWIFGGTVLILLSILFIFLNLDFLWFTPQIVFVLGIIILFLGLIIPEQREKIIVQSPKVEVTHQDIRQSPPPSELTKTENTIVVKEEKK